MAKTKTQPMKVVRFVVEGVGYFPFDMLRYDCCFPVYENETGKLFLKPTRNKEDSRITLEHRGSGNVPTTGRWESFGWKVVEILK